MHSKYDVMLCDATQRKVQKFIYKQADVVRCYPYCIVQKCTVQYMDFEICTVWVNRFSKLQYYSVWHRFQSPYTACMVSQWHEILETITHCQLTIQIQYSNVLHIIAVHYSSACIQVKNRAWSSPSSLPFPSLLPSSVTFFTSYCTVLYCTILYNTVLYCTVQSPVSSFLQFPFSQNLFAQRRSGAWRD